jgi:cation diffusion facilitator family transporter
MSSGGSRIRAATLSVNGGGSKVRAASLSVASNSLLILLKAIAASITGSIAILTEAVHSSVDLVASIVAFASVRKAGEPADEMHRYGHEKIENLSAAIEGILILVGSAVIAFEAIRRLLSPGHLQSIPVGWGVIGFSVLANVVVSTVIARRARATSSPALEGDAAHLRTDAMTSVAVLVGLVLVKAIGAQWIDSAVALAVAAVILITGIKVLMRASQVLVDTALPRGEVDEIKRVVESFAARGVVGYHELRTRQAGDRRYVDLHLQFRAGTSLEHAHRTAHEVQEEIDARLPRADVLIHIEPEDRVRPGETLKRAGPGNPFRTG